MNETFEIDKRNFVEKTNAANAVREMEENKIQTIIESCQMRYTWDCLVTLSSTVASMLKSAQMPTSDFSMAPAYRPTAGRACTTTTMKAITSATSARIYMGNALKLLFLVGLFTFFDASHGLTMTEIRIPKHIMRHEDAALGCKFDLDEGESLYSVKWYKDGFEFYRYVPRDTPPGQAFPLPGVDVDLGNSTDMEVALRRVSLQSTGRYRCEVSGEAPSFQTISGHEDMVVVVTPKHGPQITGGQPRYQIGQIVRVNCTSAPSKPICHLNWLINGVHANRSFLRPYAPIRVGKEGLEVAKLGLEFRVRG